jgi:hypothetical protein
MQLPSHYVTASYHPTGVARYDENTFIEALPHILSVALAGKSIK